jgi:predicted dehydrogenase
MVRYGIVGFGLHAVRRLMPGFRLAKNCSVTALSRRDIAKAQESAREYGVPLAFDSTADLCSSPQVDAVLVTTPNVCHYCDVLMALECGKPVLCEKPMAMNAGEAETMVEAARRAQVPLGVAQVFRFCESTRRMRARVAAGDIGRPRFARAEFCYVGREHARRWLCDRGVAGGGPIADVGVHCIDSLRFILQDEVARVYASGTTDSDSGDVESAAALLLDFRRGTRAVVLVSIRAAYRTPLEIIGEEGTLRADDGLSVEQPVALEWRRGDAIETETLSNEEAYARQVDAFSATVESGVEFPIPGQEGWRNQVILDAAYRSLQRGATEEISQLVSPPMPVR